MSMLADDSSVMEKTKDLCAAIVGHGDFGMLQEKDSLATIASDRYGRTSGTVPVT